MKAYDVTLSLEPSRRGGSNNESQYMFLCQNIDFFPKVSLLIHLLFCYRVFIIYLFFIIIIYPKNSRRLKIYVYCVAKYWQNSRDAEQIALRFLVSTVTSHNRHVCPNMYRHDGILSLNSNFIISFYRVKTVILRYILK